MKGKIWQHKVLYFLIVARYTHKTGNTEQRKWKITNLISGKQHNRVPAVTGSDLVACTEAALSRNSVVVAVSLHPLQ